MAQHQPPKNPDAKARLQTVERALRVLEALGATPSGLGLADLTRDLGIHKTIMHRLLATLEENGYVIRNPRTLIYRLGPSLFSLMPQPINLELRNIAMPILYQLMKETGESAYVAAEDGAEAVCEVLVDSPSPLRVSYPPGFRHPIYQSSTGKAMMAYMTDVTLRELFVLAETDLGLTPATLAAQLAQIRQHGHAFTVGEVIPGTYGLSAPILNPEGIAPFAVGIIGPAIRATEESKQERIAAVKKAAQDIAKAIGFG